MANVIRSKAKRTFNRGKTAVRVRMARQAQATAPKSPSFAPAVQQSLAAWTAATDGYESLLSEVEGLKQTLRSRAAKLKEASSTFEIAGATYATVVDTVSDGQAAIITSLGLEVALPRSPAAAPLAPSGLHAVPGTALGSVKLSWTPVPRARSYQLQRSAEPVTDGSWLPLDGVTKKDHVVEGLQTGQRYWFRVATVSSAGQSVFSTALPCVAR